jgi:hypothetical protein
MSCDNPILKTPRIINEALLKTYHDKPCYICGSNNRVAAHHRIKRSKSRLDIESNLVPLCFDCHSAVEKDSSSFVYYLVKMGLNGNRVNCKGMIYAQFYDWLTDADNDLYDSLPGVLIQEDKPKSKYKFSKGIKK